MRDIEFKFTGKVMTSGQEEALSAFEHLRLLLSELSEEERAEIDIEAK